MISNYGAGKKVKTTGILRKRKLAPGPVKKSGEASAGWECLWLSKAMLMGEPTFSSGQDE